MIMRAGNLTSFFVCGLSLGLACSPAVWAQGTTYSMIEAGRYLVRAGDCAACHTDSNGQPFAGGLPIQTPFGVIYSSNITPDAQTGIGKWSEDDFYNAMHHGVGRHGKYLYPAFPYPWFTKVSRDDVRAIKAFLESVAPVHRENKSPDLPWPLSMRGVMAGWNALYFHEGTFARDATKSESWNRGAYLVEGLGHCGACHTATNLVGAPEKQQKLMGGDFGEHWYAPNLTKSLRAGLGQWSAADIVEYLKTGSNAKSAAGGPMAEVVKDSTQYLSDPDLTAIATYLKDLPVEKNPDASAGAVISANSLARGQALYDDNCTGCHMENGDGIAQVFPSLKGSSAVQAQSADTLIHFLLVGASRPATHTKPTALAMPAFGGKLDDDELADLINFVRNAWGNRAASTDASAVAKVRARVGRASEASQHRDADNGAESH